MPQQHGAKDENRRSGRLHSESLGSLCPPVVDAPYQPLEKRFDVVEQRLLKFVDENAVAVCSDCTSRNPASIRACAPLHSGSLVILINFGLGGFHRDLSSYLYGFSALNWMQHRHPSCSYKSIMAANEAIGAESGVRMGFVVHRHQLFDTCLRVALGSGEGDVAEKAPESRVGPRQSARRWVANAWRSECGCRFPFTFASRAYAFTITRTDLEVNRPPR